MNNRLVEIGVGVFILAGALAFLALAFQVSGLKHFSPHDYYRVTAEFDNIGSLKPRAPVRIAGVKIGQVESISLNKREFKARVTLQIERRDNNLPVDTSAKILTEGLLGSNYISLIPGYEAELLADGSSIHTTYPAIILENLIGQLVFNGKEKDKKE